MLQQTQVARVVPALPRLPRGASRRRPPAAAAGPGDVLTLWAGLGYNRRAVQLHQAAVAW